MFRIFMYTCLSVIQETSQKNMEFFIESIYNTLSTSSYFNFDNKIFYIEY